MGEFIGSCQGISIKLIQAFSKTLNELGSLQELTWSFAGFRRFDNEGLQLISQALGKLSSSLRILNFNLSG